MRLVFVNNNKIKSRPYLFSFSKSHQVLKTRCSSKPSLKEDDFCHFNLLLALAGCKDMACCLSDVCALLVNHETNLLPSQYRSDQKPFTAVLKTQMNQSFEFKYDSMFTSLVEGFYEKLSAIEPSFGHGAKRKRHHSAPLAAI